MVTRYTSRLENLGAPLWVRGLGVVVLALILLVNLGFVTISWAPHGGARIYAMLALLWVLALVALLFLRRLWRTTVSPRR
jgi:membrane protein YdbS with pleckstrin-like domain